MINGAEVNRTDPLESHLVAGKAASFASKLEMEIAATQGAVIIRTMYPSASGSLPHTVAVAMAAIAVPLATGLIAETESLYGEDRALNNDPA
jgi:hypothetical protein